MESIVQIQNVNKKELFGFIQQVIEDKISSLEEKKESENLTVQQTAKLLGVTEITIHNYIKKGLIPANKIGRRIVIKRSDVNKALTGVKSLKYKR